MRRLLFVLAIILAPSMAAAQSEGGNYGIIVNSATFAAVQSALAAATSAVSLNGQDLITSGNIGNASIGVGAITLYQGGYIQIGPGGQNRGTISAPSTGLFKLGDSAGNAATWQVSKLNFIQTSVPGSSAATGTTGDFTVDTAGNLYLCIATNTWRKFSGVTF